MQENTKMRAKMVVSEIISHEGGFDTLKFRAVCKEDGYPADGSDENNSFARWTPTANLEMVVSNPNLVGTFKVGQKFYVDFSEAS
jgi:hypothetical protein